MPIVFHTEVIAEIRRLVTEQVKEITAQYANRLSGLEQTQGQQFGRVQTLENRQRALEQRLWAIEHPVITRPLRPDDV